MGGLWDPPGRYKKKGMSEKSIRVTKQMSALALRHIPWYAGSVSARHKSHMNDFNGSGGYQASSEFYSLLQKRKEKKKTAKTSTQKKLTATTKQLQTHSRMVKKPKLPFQ